ncbi:MAG: DUF721 domain-containing protein [Gemmatimonadales bacterium]
MDDSGPRKIAETLKAYLSRSGFSRRLKQAAVVTDWNDLVGPQIAAVTTPRFISADGTLFVDVVSAAWMQELHMMAPEIVRQLGQRGRKVRQIRWRAAPESPPNGHGAGSL